MLNSDNKLHIEARQTPLGLITGTVITLCGKKWNPGRQMKHIRKLTDCGACKRKAGL